MQTEKEILLADGHKPFILLTYLSARVGWIVIERKISTEVKKLLGPGVVPKLYSLVKNPGICNGRILEILAKVKLDGGPIHECLGKTTYQFKLSISSRSPGHIG